jgi:hypothetical protein
MRERFFFMNKIGTAVANRPKVSLVVVLLGVGAAIVGALVMRSRRSNDDVDYADAA